MKNTTLLTWAVIIGWLVILASTTFASIWQEGSFSWLGRWMMGNWYLRNNSGSINQDVDAYRENIKREVKNIDSGAEITMTSTDPATIEHIKLMVTQMSNNNSLNWLIKTERVEIANWMKMTVTSTDANTVKLIQERSNNATSWVFGNSWRGRGWMIGNWFWQGRGRFWGGEWCPMFE